MKMLIIVYCVQLRHKKGMLMTDCSGYYHVPGEVLSNNCGDTVFAKPSTVLAQGESTDNSMS